MYMYNKQDATPTWSGFNYQGKVSLLCVMEHINYALTHSIDLSVMCFEIEKNEDLTIYKKNMPIAMYQMKAYSKKDDRKVKTIYSPYKTTCDKLKKNRDALHKKLEVSNDSVTALFLVTINEVKNWSEDTNIYNRDIDIYKYNDQHVGLLDSKKHIENEIGKFAKLTTESSEEKMLGVPLENYYLALCDFLDKQLAQFHLAGKNSDYKISFKKISELFLKVSNNNIELEESRFKERIYNAVCKEWSEAIATYCSQCEECDINCSILLHQEHSSKIDLRNYLKSLNPHKRDWDSETKYLSHFDEQKFRDIILGLVHTFNREDIILLKDGLELKNPIQAFSENYKTIIPTLISLASPREDRQKASLQTTMSDISKNIDIHSRIDRHILSANIGLSEPAYHLGDESITYFPTIEGEMEERKSVSNYKIETIILDVQKIVEALKEDV